MAEETDPGNLLVRTVLAALLVTTVLYRLGSTVADADLWGYLAFGRVFWENGRFPYDDPFSFVPTLHPWVYHELLTGVVFYPLYQATGAPCLQFLKYACVLGTLGLAYATARKRGSTAIAAAFGVFLVHNLFRMGYSPVRAQVFTYLFFALSLYLLESARLSRRYGRLWWLLPVTVLWCNLHGGFPGGLGLIFIYGLGAVLSRQPARPYWLLFSLCGLATLINPYGLKYWTYLYQAITMPRPMISEWASVPQAYLSGANPGSLLYFLLLLAFAAIWCFRTREITPALALALTAYLGWRHLRHQLFFLILCATFLPGLWSAYLEDLRSRPGLKTLYQRLGWKIPLAAAILVVVLNTHNFLKLSPFSFRLPTMPVAESPFYYPLGAIDYLQAHNLSGKILTFFDWGEYLIWDLSPRCRVALDGRFETVYPPEVVREYLDFIYAAPNWREFLQKYPPDFILIDSRTRIYHLLQAEPGWRTLYTDAGCALFSSQ